MAGTVKCKTCGKPVAAGDRFCGGCGSAVVMGDETVLATPTHGTGTSATQCPKCGTSIGRDDRFCPQCGTSRPEPATVVSHVSLRNSQAVRLIEATKGEFEVLEQLGTGAMGAVYLAKDVSLGRQVAIKVIAPHLLSDETMISRFRQEAQTVASLRHPNIVNVHAVRQSAEMHYFVMEFIDGPPLRNIVKSHAPLDIDVTRAILFQVGSALSHAHRSGRGVIHRDVKPANIMVDREGDSFVTDFGISKIQEAQTGLTQTGATIGTPEYMSPEQCRGDVLTGASDQYALGIVAYEMLCGHTPFTGSQYNIMVSHTTEPPKPIRDLRPDCPPHVAEAIERMLAKAPHERWPDLDNAVMAMGGAPLGYHDPVRRKIKALTGATVTHIPAVAGGSRSGSRSSLETATSVTVTGLPQILETGERIPLRADVRGTGNMSLSGLGIMWASTDPSIARIEGGFVEGVSPGTVSIMASAGNVASSVLLTVAEPSPASVLVRPSSIRMQRGGRFALSAQVHDKRGRTLEREVKWLSSDPKIATVSAKGEVAAVGSGPVTITAQSEGASGTASIVIEAPAVVAPPAAAAAPAASSGAVSAPERPGAAAPPRATPKAEPAPAAKPPARAEPAPERAAAARAARPPKPAAPKPTAPRPASVTSRAAQGRPLYRHPAAIAAALVLVVGGSVLGLLSGGGDGETPPGSTGAAAGGQGTGGEQPAATAGAGGAAQPGRAPAASATSPGAQTAAGAGGQTGTGAATGASASGSAQPSARQPAAAQVAPTTPPGTQAGATPSTPQPTTRPAPTQTTAGTPPTGAPAAAAAPSPQRVDVAVPNASMQVGGTQAVSAQVFSSSGPMGRGTYSLAWRSSNPGVLSVNAQSGALRAAGPGTAWVVASAGSARDSVLVSVAAPAPAAPVVASVEIAEADFSLEVGASRALSASVLDTGRRPVGGSISWTSSDPAVAGVDAAGRVTAGAPGTARITASAQGFSDQVGVSVSAAAPALPSADQARTAVEAYVTMLGQGDRDGVSRLWGSADTNQRDELLGLMGERNFAATLQSVGTPAMDGASAVVTFQVATTYRTFAGANRQRSLSFRGALQAAGGGWQLASAVFQ